MRKIEVATGSQALQCLSGEAAGRTRLAIAEIVAWAPRGERHRIFSGFFPGPPVEQLGDGTRVSGWSGASFVLK